MQLSEKQNDIQSSAWPESYYLEIDPAKRLPLLNDAISEGLEPEENSIRKELFYLRYEENIYAESGYADRFMRAFMNIGLLTKNRPSRFGMKSARKKMLGYLSLLGLDNVSERSDLYRDLLFKEYCHMGQVFIALSKADKNYGSVLAGFGKIKEDTLEKKLRTDLAAAGIDAADLFDLREEMDLWLKGLEEARARMIPNSEPLI